MSNDIALLFLLMIFSTVHENFSFQLSGSERHKRSVSNDSSLLDTGVGPIGVYLSYSMKHLPLQREHYYFRIHHHYHNRQKVLKQIHVFPKYITLCKGNPGSFCPNGTWALCTKNGAIRCIVSLWATDGCEESFFKHCAKVTLPCSFYTPECRLSNRFGDNQQFDIGLPCISILQMYANLIYVNGTAIAQDLIKIYPPDMFCVTILALPDELTKGEELFDRTNKIFGKLAVKVLGIDRR